MIWIILAAGLGANILVATLLFRRLREDLNRQLRDMRAEHNSEWILRALKDAPEERERAAQAANGRPSELPPMGPQPVRRKRHLGLFIGGAAAALITISTAAREIWRNHSGQLVAGATAAAVTATALTLIIFNPWTDDADHEPPSSAPTAGPTDTLPPGYTQPPGSSPAPGPSSTATGSQPSGSPAGLTPTSPPAPTALMPIDDVSQQPTGPHTQPGEPPPADGEPPPSIPGVTPPAETPTDQPVQTLTPGLCIGLALAPALDIEACLPGGGA